MIKGMTGFGSAQFSSKDAKGVVEIKSLNHRYFDLTFYLPTGFSAVEQKIRQAVSKDIKRGKVTVAIKVTKKSQAKIEMNKEAIGQYIKHAKQLKREFKLKNDLSLSDITRLPGVVEVKESVVTAESLWPEVSKGIKKCIKALATMRQREGRSLAADVRDKLTRMKGQVGKIKTRARAILSANKKKLTEEEFVSFQKGNDINEELIRLAHYIDELKTLLSSNVSVGKKMDFIAQEMQRETNTIGSKLQDKIISNAVIALKSKIEKIREQSQNIE